MVKCRHPDYPSISPLAIEPRRVERPGRINHQHMIDEQCDMQGIYWSKLQTTQTQAREVRRMTFTNGTSVIDEQPSFEFGNPAYKISFQSVSSPALPDADSHFRFRETATTSIPFIFHRQLRHSISASSKNAVFYAYRNITQPFDLDKEIGFGDSPVQECGVKCFIPASGSEEYAIDLSEAYDEPSGKIRAISCISASDGILVIGDALGLYALKSLSADFGSDYTTGTVSTQDLDSQIVINHVHTFLDRRSGLPQAVFVSNDTTISVLDCTSNKWVRRHSSDFEVNCSATSPDGRQRILVRDSIWPILEDAETGEELATLTGHKDNGFSCAWSPDGLTFATGCQDGIVQIWDARKTSRSVHSLPSEMGGVRAMQFSPLGAGKPVLVMAEPADFVSIVDARTYESKQKIEFFGEIAGITMPLDGSKLFIGNSDPTFGGIMEFDRMWNSDQYEHQRLFHRGFEEMEVKENLEDTDLGYSSTWPHITKADDVANVRRGRYPMGLEHVFSETMVLDEYLWRTKSLDWFPESDLDRDKKCLPSRMHRQRRRIELEKLVI